MDLAHEANVSPRHLSFVETGRSRPSAEMILSLARRLDVPLREQNDLLLAAGFAPRFSETSLDDPQMAQVLKSLQRLLHAHEPYPGLALDRRWNVVLANWAASPIAALLPPGLATPTVNIFRASLHPDGLAKYTRNFAAWATYLLGKLGRLVMLTGDPGLAALEAEIGTYPNVANLVSDPAAPTETPGGDLLVPFELTIGEHDLSMFTTLTTFGTPRDVTLEDLAIELFFPTDSTTEAFFTNPRPKEATR